MVHTKPIKVQVVRIEKAEPKATSYTGEATLFSRGELQLSSMEAGPILQLTGLPRPVPFDQLMRIKIPDGARWQQNGDGSWTLSW